MFNIKASDTGAAYMHLEDDPTRTATARRATFKPSINDKITNLFARKEHPKTAGFVGSLRNMDLKLRQSINNRKLDNDRARLERMAPEMAPEASPQEQDRHAAKQERLRTEIERREIKQGRLQRKQILSGMAREGTLDSAALDQANRSQRDALKRRDYRDTEGLSKTEQHNVGTYYLSHGDDRHGIRINDLEPPGTASLVASMVSAGYDRGSSGVTAAARSTVQHALVGVHAAALSLKGGTARVLSKSEQLDQGSRNRMAVSARRADNQRKMLGASLQGNDALKRAFEKGVDAQIEDAKELRRQDKKYEVRQSTEGVEPPQTSYAQRRASIFYRDKFAKLAQQAGNSAAGTPAGHAALDEKTAEEKGMLSSVSSDLSGMSDSTAASQQAPDAKTQARAGRVMRFAVEVANLAPRAAKAFSSEKANPVRHAAVREAADFNIRARRSALQGTLLQEVQGDKARKAMEHFPIADGIAPPMPWHRQGETDLSAETASLARRASTISEVSSQGELGIENGEDRYSPALPRRRSTPPEPPPRPLKLHTAEVEEDARARAALEQDAASQEYIGGLSPQEIEDDLRAMSQLSARVGQAPQTSARYIPGGDDDPTLHLPPGLNGDEHGGGR